MPATMHSPPASPTPCSRCGAAVGMGGSGCCPSSVLPHGDGVQPCCCPHPHPTSALCLSQLDQGITVGSLQELATELEQLVGNAVRTCPQG